MARAKKLGRQILDKPPVTPSTILALLLLLKDSAESVRRLELDPRFSSARLPKDIAQQEEVRELDALRARERRQARMTQLPRFEALSLDRATPERCGILGGRYKRLYSAGRDAVSGTDAKSGEEHRGL